jgi:cytochrome c oxidase subunit 3
MIETKKYYQSKKYPQYTIKLSSKSHPFHILPPSAWPFCTAWSVFFLALGATSYFHNFGINFLFWFGLAGVIISIFFWIMDVFKEADAGYHTLAVQKGFRLGFILFIASEVMFFVSFFWAFFHSSLSPTPFIGGVWPPEGIECFSPWSIPLLNTLLLLGSGVTVTRTHMLIMLGNHRLSLCILDTTVILGLYFMLCQYIEYSVATFTISDGIFGSLFYMLTGFHGFHVFVGLIMLLFARYRLATGKLHTDDHLSFELASWYWHFVDVVWIGLFVSVYVWGGRFF